MQPLSRIFANYNVTKIFQVRKISLCLTNFNRTEEVTQSFKQVLNDERIGEVIISDDASNQETRKYLELLAYPAKVIFHNENAGMARNKMMAIKAAINEYCILFDSDNVIDKKYLDALYKRNWFPDIILMPDYAKPHFDYRALREERINKYSVKRVAKKQMFDCLMNTCNYFVHRDTYLKIFEHNPAIKGCDTAWFNYLWLKAGNSFIVVPQMEYYHKVHDGSEWLKDADYNMKSGEEIKNLMLAL